jgi:hypothetical protein
MWPSWKKNKTTAPLNAGLEERHAGGVTRGSPARGGLEERFA